METFLRRIIPDLIICTNKMTVVKTPYGQTVTMFLSKFLNKIKLMNAIAKHVISCYRLRSLSQVSQGSLGSQMLLRLFLLEISLHMNDFIECGFLFLRTLLFFSKISSHSGIVGVVPSAECLSALA